MVKSGQSFLDETGIEYQEQNPFMDGDDMEEEDKEDPDKKPKEPKKKPKKEDKNGASK